MKCLVLFLLVFGAVAHAQVSKDLRPVARSDASAVIAEVEVARLSELRPRLRPARAPDGSLTRSLRPNQRTSDLVRRAMAQRRKQARGSVCGDRDIQGEAIGFVPGRLSACGIKDAVRLKSVAGVTLSQQAVVDCPTAKALKTWVQRGVKPAVGDYGGGIAGLRVAAHYACRTRNNQPGAKISEHGKGRAIDISGFRFKNGELVTLLKGWNAPATRKMMREMHRAACGPFGTVLGPNADRFHQDHFHFDTARYRSGSYCR